MGDKLRAFALQLLMLLICSICSLGMFMTAVHDGLDHSAGVSGRHRGGRRSIWFGVFIVLMCELD